MKVYVRVECPITVDREREKLYKMLKDVLKTAENIANDRRVKPKTRLQAFRLVGYIASILAGVLKDFQLDEIQREIMELEEQVKSRER